MGLVFTWESVKYVYYIDHQQNIGYQGFVYHNLQENRDQSQNYRKNTTSHQDSIIYMHINNFDPSPKLCILQQTNNDNNTQTSQREDTNLLEWNLSKKMARKYQQYA